MGSQQWQQQQQQHQQWQQWQQWQQQQQHQHQQQEGQLQQDRGAQREARLDTVPEEAGGEGSSVGGDSRLGGSEGRAAPAAFYPMQVRDA